MSKHSLRKCSILLAILLSILALSLGIGLGVGLPSRQPSVLVPSSNQSALLNDTSLASAVTSDGDRYVFFQNSRGFISHSVFDSAGNTWLPSNPTGSIECDRTPRNRTPMAILSVPVQDQEIASQVGVNETFILFYIDTTDSLIGINYIASNNERKKENMFNISIPVSQSSRSLCITPILLNSTFEQEAIVFYSGPTNDINGLHVYYSSDFKDYTHGNSTPSWEWTNITEDIFGSGSPYDSPVFGCSHSLNGNLSSTRLTFLNTSALSDTASISEYALPTISQNWTEEGEFGGFEASFASSK